LRGADTGPNYDRKFVDDAVRALESVQAARAVMIDCSHGNSNKDHRNQLKVVANVAEQLSAKDHPNNKYIIGTHVQPKRQSVS
jgi:3-deoxy-7-phosphoheptulonate synthase